ncbi:DUF3426 domain-containing protein [Burkholderia sp. Ac-20353]|uniref:DUF3426 domain-containing protein n=1 Tax=Burkholderia sp. Ac-20353 TaxID=2703894 RepID=UPI00197BF7C1|nr:DUF3426 domain-containing protein [Burkholderia sp. Ac-20353]MBN3789210.1 DUF3426 domain-containing protein [Burkholderia sp. Ac-20353]
MLLATRCPHCETVFRLQQEQLALHNGLVRCGHCRQVFDAAASLVDEHASQPEPTPVVAASNEGADGGGRDAAESVVAHPSVGEAPVAEPEPAPVVAASNEGAASDWTGAAESVVADTAAAHPSAGETPATTSIPEPAAAADAHAPEAAEHGSPHAAPAPRLFVDSTHDVDAAHADFRPDHWDMWAPWLDGSVDPRLQHSSRSVSTEPLVPVALPDSGVTSGAAPGVVRVTGTPQQPAPVFPAIAEAPAAEPPATDTLPPIPAAHGDDEPAASAYAALGRPHGPHDVREPYLAADLPPASTTEVPAVDTHAPQAPDAADHVPLSAPRDTHEPRFVADVPPAIADARADDDHAASRTEREPRFAADASREPFSAAPTDDDRPHFAVTRESRAPQRRGLFGGFLGGLVAAALAVLLVVQLAWWQRESLMIYWPVTQGWFRQLCAPLGCKVTPPRAIDGLRLDASDLRQIDGPRVLELKVPLTNRYRVALAYPSLELTLLDDTNHVTVRRVLAPRDYVRPGTPIEAGLPAGATQTMIVRVETNGTPASNFRVQIFYP